MSGSLRSNLARACPSSAKTPSGSPESECSGWPCLFLFATWRVRLLAALPLLVMVIATGSRGPMLSLLAGGLAYLVLKSRRPVLPLTGFALLAIATPLLAPISVTDPIFGGQERLGSISVRLDVWKVAIDVWLNNPLIGAASQSTRAYSRVLRPHNSIVDLLSRSGLIGLALVLVAGVSAVRRPAAGRSRSHW